MTENASPPPRTDVPPDPSRTSSLPPFLGHLRRSTSDHKVAGVAGGLGRATGIDPLIYRIVFVIVSIFAGVGVLLYGVAWLLLPEDGQPESPGEKLAHGRGDGSVVAPIVVTVIGLPFVGGFAQGGSSNGLVVAGTIGAIAAFLVLRRIRTVPAAAVPGIPEGPAAPVAPAPWASTSATSPAQTSVSLTKPEPTTYAERRPHVPPFGPPSYLPTPEPVVRPKKQRSHLPSITLSAALLVSGALWVLPLNDDNQRHAAIVLAGAVTVLGLGLIVGGLFGHTRRVILLAIPLTVALLITSSDLHGGFGDRDWHPVTAQAASERTFQLYGGNAELDLSDLHPASGQTIVVRADVHAGRLAVTAPREVTMDVRTTHRVGETSLPDTVSVNNQNDVRTFAGAADAGTLILELHVTYGYLEVRRATS